MGGNLHLGFAPESLAGILSIYPPILLFCGARNRFAALSYAAVCSAAD